MPIGNTGKKIYTILVQYNSRTGQPTGKVKPNVPGDPDYVPPVTDLVNCGENLTMQTFQTSAFGLPLCLVFDGSILNCPGSGSIQQLPLGTYTLTATLSGNPITPGVANFRIVDSVAGVIYLNDASIPYTLVVNPTLFQVLLVAP